MMRNASIKTNGYGSFKQKIVVRVYSAYVDMFAEAFNMKPFRTTPEHSDFMVQILSTNKTDDETVMYGIEYHLPDLPSFKGWEILWNESSY